MEDFGDTAGAIEEAQAPALENRGTLGVAIEQARRTAEFLEQMSEVH